MLDHFNEPINRQLETLISQCKEPLLREVMTYAALGEGKRLRPKLLLASYEAVAGEFDFTVALGRRSSLNATVLDFACAVEMIHAYSLIHDDLPAMDNDDFRRGRPTCHKVYGEAMAILAGDGLQSLATEVMLSCIYNFTSDAIHALVYIIEGAGVNGMIGGQVSDIINEGKSVDAETLAAIHHRKTGCMITAALKAGAVLGDGDVMFEMEELGHALGLAFQIRDDILDVTSTAENLGKPIGSDSKNQKSTYVTIHGMDAAKAEYDRLSGEAMKIISGIECKTDTLHKLVTLTLLREK